MDLITYSTYCQCIVMTLQAVRRLSTVYSDDVLRCEETDDDDEMTSLLLQLRHEHQRRQQAENQLRRVQVRLSICLSVCRFVTTSDTI